MSSLNSVSHRLSSIERDHRRGREGARGGREVDKLLALASDEELERLRSAIASGDDIERELVLGSIEGSVQERDGDWLSRSLDAELQRRGLQPPAEVDDAGLDDVLEDALALPLRELAVLHDIVAAGREMPNGATQFASAAVAVMERLVAQGHRRRVLGFDSRVDRTPAQLHPSLSGRGRIPSPHPRHRRWGSCWYGELFGDQAEPCGCLSDALDHPRADELGRAGVRALARHRHGPLDRSAARRQRRELRRRRRRLARPRPAAVVAAPEHAIASPDGDRAADDVPRLDEIAVEAQEPPVARRRRVSRGRYSIATDPLAVGGVEEMYLRGWR